MGSYTPFPNKGDKGDTGAVGIAGCTLSFVELMAGEGVTFFCGVNVGVDKKVEDLLAEYDAVLYCGGSETPRPAGIPGDDLDGVFRGAARVIGFG
mgnify:CR=1 FL=1